MRCPARAWCYAVHLLFVSARAGYVVDFQHSPRLAVAGDLPAGGRLADNFRNEPWLGFEVVGVYHDPKRAASLLDWAGNFERLIDDAKPREFTMFYIAMS